MEIPPDLRQTIKSWADIAFYGTDAGQCMDLNQALDLVKKSQSDWRPLFSIGVHAAFLCNWNPKVSGLEPLLHELVGHALEPIEAAYHSLGPDIIPASLQKEQARALFSARFALGFLLMAKGDEDQSKKILHDLAATQVSKPGNYSPDQGILNWTPDIAVGKWVACQRSILPCVGGGDAGEALYLITESASCLLPSWKAILLDPIAGVIPLLLDLWAQKCVEEDSTGEHDFPTFTWLYLFARAAELFSLCNQTEPERIPSECKPWSFQFLAAKFGQLVACFVALQSRWADDPIGHFLHTRNLHDSDGLSDEVVNMIFWSVNVAVALLSEYGPGRDWHKAQEHYLWIYRNHCSRLLHFSDDDAPPELRDFGPDSELYWAMRIGFADMMLQSTTAIVEKPQYDPATVIRLIETIKDIDSTIALRQQKHHQEILDRLPPGKREILRRLQEYLGSIWKDLPGRVVNYLVKAERLYGSEVNDDDAKVCFCKAVEASLNCCLVEPLACSVEKRDDKRICLCFPPPRGSEHKSPPQLRRLNLREWSDILEIATTAPFQKDLARLGTADMTGFLKGHFGWTGMPDLRQLCNSLRTISQCRGGSAHDQDANSRYDREKRELDEIRNLVLGIDRTSVITQIFQMFRIPRGP